MDENDPNHDEWIFYLEDGLRAAAELAMGHVAVSRAKQVVEDAMVAMGEERDIKQVTSSLLLGGSRRNMVRWAKRDGLEENFTIVKTILFILARLSPRALTPYDILIEVCKEPRYKKVEQIRVEEVLAEIEREGWVLKQGEHYRLVDKTTLHEKASKYSRRRKLMRYREAIHGTMSAYLREEPASDFHFASFRVAPEQFQTWHQSVREHMTSSAEQLGAANKEETNEEEYQVLIFVRKRK